MANTEKYSYSKLDTYVQCPFRFKLKYIDGNYIFNNSIATEFGTLIHETEETIAKNIINNEPIDYIKLKNNIILKLSELQKKYANDFYELDKSNRTYENKTYYYLEEGIYKLEQFMRDNPNLEIVGVEQKFNFELWNKVFNGFIDRIFYNKDEDKYLIQDIKTYAVPVEKEKLATPLQFVIYNLAAQQMFNCSPEQISCEYQLPLCDLTQAAGTKGYMKRGTDKLEKIFNGINQQNFEPSPSPLCNWCEFCATNPDATKEGKYLCPYFCKWHRDTRNKSDLGKVEYHWEGLDKHQQILESYQNKLQEEVKKNG